MISERFVALLNQLQVNRRARLSIRDYHNPKGHLLLELSEELVPSDVRSLVEGRARDTLKQRHVVTDQRYPVADGI